jgi:cytochrome P450
MTAPAKAPAYDVPDHVPAELVQFFDFRTGLGGCPHEVVSRLHAGPRIFYSPVSHQQRASTGHGAWVVTKAEDIRYVLQNPDIFSSAAPRSHAAGETWKLIPLEVDPPEHGKYRTLLNPLFSPKALKSLDEPIRNWAVELIDTVVGQGECDFVRDFAEMYPIGIFLDLLGLPRTELPRFRTWVDVIVHDAGRRGEIMQTLKAYLEGVIDDRMATLGGDDLISQVTRMKIEDRDLSREEMAGIVFLLFIGGLDTVVNSLSFHFRYLAEHPEDQSRLRADPGMIPDAVEEMFRAFPVVTTSRLVTRDTELAGVALRAGDMVTTSTLLSTRDPDEFANPGVVDITRSPNRHNAFAFGPHRCLGSHLARREIVIALEEWMRRVPTFAIREGATITAAGGGVMGIDTLPLVWSA